ncbi:nascent polypeptide-associated complex subunit alpha, muscle-specific form-like [Hordeum vulgare subsp. vulgare]|uniref:nascent polypeptide-associated complex subunit alpha, muscle-specific form-like n=1 Tax=Hordeum vulgare subsp. vulgare TaxID=112509 RepID=UPI001D1A3B77|nr:nascent polypeptide-associated complex subunit alpha, muscle-specific form-like [Hordeum vulgare subsp. vulgare]
MPPAASPAAERLPPVAPIWIPRETASPPVAAPPCPPAASPAAERLPPVAPIWIPRETASPPVAAPPCPPAASPAAEHLGSLPDLDPEGDRLASPRLWSVELIRSLQSTKHHLLLEPPRQPNTSLMCERKMEREIVTTPPSPWKDKELESRSEPRSLARTRSPRSVRSPPLPRSPRPRRAARPRPSSPNTLAAAAPRRSPRAARAPLGRRRSARGASQNSLGNKQGAADPPSETLRLRQLAIEEEDDATNNLWKVAASNPLSCPLRYFPKAFKPRARPGSEVEDLGNLVKLYADWHSRLIPYYSFEQFVRKAEKVGASSRVRVVYHHQGQWVRAVGDCRRSGHISFDLQQVNDFILISESVYTREQILKMEKAILNRLEWNLTVPTLYVFLVRFAKVASSSSNHKNDKEMENTVFFFFAELALL